MAGVPGFPSGLARSRRVSSPAFLLPCFPAFPFRLEADGDRLGLHEVVDAVRAVLAADAGLLEAAERDLRRDRERVVGADDAVLQPLGDAEDAADVAGEEVGGQAERRCRWPCAIASSSVSNSMIGSTGPKVSSYMIFISAVTLARTVGW